MSKKVYVYGENDLWFGQVYQKGDYWAFAVGITMPDGSGRFVATGGYGSVASAERGMYGCVSAFLECTFDLVRDANLELALPQYD